MKNHKYKLKYDLKIDTGSFTKEEVKETKMGGTDALLLASIIYPEDGSLSIFFQSIDGRNEGKQLDDNEWFKVWLMLSGRLGDSKTLPDSKKEITKIAMDAIKRLVTEEKVDNGD